MPIRLLPASEIPTSLWRQPDSVLLLPADLASAYRQVLTNRNWLEQALAERAGGAIGGAKPEATKKHFVESFAGSCARVELVALDPHETVNDASDWIMNAFAGGRLGLLDVPSGAGAAAMSLLTVVAALRSEGRLPRQPLEVFLLGGDYSETARILASEMGVAIKARLEDQGISLHDRFVAWDACDAQSTTELLHSWMEHARDCRRYFVVAANCSGFLENEGKFKEAQPNLEQVFRWANARRSDVAWIEPQTNAARLNLLPRLFQWVEKKLRGLFQVRAGEGSDAAALAEARLADPLKEGMFPVRVSLVRFEHHEGGAV